MSTFIDKSQPPEPDDKPKKKIITYPCDEALRARLREMRDPTKEISNNILAQALGVNAAVISQYLNNDGCVYSGDVKRLELKLDDWLRNYARRRASGVNTIQCEIADEIRKAVEYIRKTNDVGEIIAASGEGKTRALELIIAGMPTAMLYHVRSWNRDLGSIESAMFDAVGSSGYNHKQKRAIFIVNKLRGSNRLLIVDDAHKLTRPALQWLFDLQEETQIPVALVGTYDLADKLEDDSQRSSRTGLYWPIASKSAEGNRKLIEHMVRELAPAANGQIEQLCDLAEQVAIEHGHFRSVHKQLKIAAELMETSKFKTWPDAFRAAHSLLVRKYKLN